MLVTKEYMNRKWPDVERVWFATQESWVGERKFLIVLKDASRKEFQNRYPTLADRHIIEFPTKSRPTVTELARDIAAALRTGPSRNG